MIDLHQPEYFSDIETFSFTRECGANIMTIILQLIHTYNRTTTSRCEYRSDTIW